MYYNIIFFSVFRYTMECFLICCRLFAPICVFGFAFELVNTGYAYVLLYFVHMR